jgi:signal transduction histidine kinase
MKQEAALTLRAQGELGRLHDWPGAAEKLSEAHRALGALEREIERVTEQEEPGPQPLAIALAERLETLLDTGRRVVGALTKEEVYTALREAGLTLLRGEYSIVVEVRTGEEKNGGSAIEVVGPAAGAPEDPSLRELVDNDEIRRACAERRPIRLQEHEADAPSDSLLLAGVRSVLCAPVLAHDRAVACLWVVHTQVGKVFGEAEASLAQFVSSLAGTSLEVVDAVERIQALSDERGRLYQEAQLALEVRDAFVSVAAHELRTPMTSLALNVQDLLETTERGRPPPPEELRLRLSSAERSVRRFKALVENLLDVSRASSGLLHLELEPVDLSVVVREVVRDLDAVARQAGCAVRLDLPDSLAGFWDRTRLESVATNLLTNALKFGAGAPVDVEASEADGVATLRIRDRGIGIAPEDQARIFDRFERAASFRHYGGMGLGLWLSRAIVEGMGGRIEVDSEPGRGSTFTVRLPLKP